MKKMRKSLLAVSVVAAMTSQAALAETEAERIKRLEAMVEQQQKMLETLTEEVRQLRAGQQATTIKVEELTHEPEPMIVTGDEYVEPPKNPLSMKVYGFAMADAIYDVCFVFLFCESCVAYCLGIITMWSSRRPPLVSVL